MAKSGMIGRKAHVARLRKLAGEGMVREVGGALFAAGEMIQVESQIGITTGAVSGKNHVPGTPGGYPNNDTGDLANSHETNQIAPLKVEVSVNAPHAQPVHDGHSGRQGYPYLQLARDAKKKDAIELVEKAVARAVRRSRSRD